MKTERPTGRRVKVRVSRSAVHKNPRPPFNWIGIRDIFFCISKFYTISWLFIFNSPGQKEKLRKEDNFTSVRKLNNFDA